MDDLRWTGERPELRSPVLVCGYRGWNDAGEAASAALGFLVESFEAVEIARIDPEEYFDFTATRPTIRLTEGTTRVIEWPDTVIHAARVPGADGDLLILQGPEPALRWRRYTATVLGLASDLGVRMIVSLGALLADIPHTRPVTITGIGSDEALVERLGFQRTSYEGPTGIVGVVHSASAKAGLPSASLWASVPHYVAAAPNPKAALALLRSFEGVTGVMVDASELEEAAEEYETQVNAAVASDPDVRAFVERLEQMSDEAEDDAESQPIPSADAIARDFQRFLRQRGPDAG